MSLAIGFIHTISDAHPGHTRSGLNYLKMPVIRPQMRSRPNMETKHSLILNRETKEQITANLCC